MPDLRADLVIAPCRIAARDHDARHRQYAHVGHVPNVICVAPAFFDLPDSHYFGILAHEIGHCLADPSQASSYLEEEELADRAANTAFGIRIRYRSTRHGDHLQWLRRDDIEWFSQYITQAKIDEEGATALAISLPSHHKYAS